MSLRWSYPEHEGETLVALGPWSKGSRKRGKPVRTKVFVNVLRSHPINKGKTYKPNGARERARRRARMGQWLKW